MLPVCFADRLLVNKRKKTNNTFGVACFLFAFITLYHIAYSEIYKEYIKADRAIYEDKKAIELSLKKDELEKELNYLYTGEESKILIDEKMKKINEIQKELYSLESVKRYMELRMKLKEVLSVLEQGILRSVK